MDNASLAEEQQIEGEARPVGCPAAGPHLLHILRREPEEAAQLFGGPFIGQGFEAAGGKEIVGHGAPPFHLSCEITCTFASISATIAMWRSMRQFRRAFFCPRCRSPAQGSAAQIVGTS